MAADEYSSGFPSELMVQGKQGVYRTPSGKRISYQMGKARIRIRDQNSVDSPRELFLGMVASITVRRDPQTMDIYRTLSCVVRTVSCLTGKHHPDLRGKGLLAQAVSYYDRQSPITHARCSWLSTAGFNTNYDQYVAALSSLGEGPYSQDQHHEAAFSTWSGAALRGHGFNEIRSLQKNGGSVAVTFARSAVLLLPAAPEGIIYD